MLKSPIKNAEILKSLSLMGEGDAVIVTGCRVSISSEVKVIDLAVTDNMPRVSDIVKLLCDNVVFTEMTVASEAEDGLKEEVKFESDVKTSELTCRQLQVVSKNARFVIRTGDMRSQAIVALRI